LTDEASLRAAVGEAEDRPPGAPAGTPAAIIDILNHAVNEGLRTGEVRASLENLGVEPRLGSPGDFALVLAEQAKEWKAVIEATGIELE